MRVAYTIEQCWHRVPGGTASAALAVARAMAADPQTPDVGLVGVSAFHRRPAPDPYTPPMPTRRLPLPRLALYEGWSRVGFPPVELATGRVDVVHATTIMVPPRRAPLVVTIHDLAFLHEAEYFTAHGNRIFRRSLTAIRRRADLVLCSSLATMDDCLAAGIGADRLRHVPLGVSPRLVASGQVEMVRSRYGIVGPYLLFAGTREPRKNLAGLLAAFALLNTAHRLVVVGPDGWGTDTAMPARVITTGFVSDDDLAALYAGADVFCYPSLREGYGLPVLEAMSHGTPVVTSRGTSTEEAAGGAAVLVEPTDPTDIARGIVEALARHTELAALGRDRAAEATWSATAALTVAAYREVAR